MDGATQTETALGMKPGARGRKDLDKQEAVPDTKMLDKRLPLVIEVMQREQQVKEEVSDIVKAVAESSGFMAKIVRQLARAKMNDKVGDVKREVGQMTLALGDDE